jgi:RNA polymerase sigma-70 factor, ECF subfamily
LGQSHQDASEAALVLLARVGDDTAFATLVRRRHGAVRGLLRRLSGDAALGDDLAQETFIQAWRSLGRLREPGSFGGWLRHIAVNVWLQHVRRRRLATETLDDHDPPASEDAAMTVVTRLDLDAALASLRPVERLCLVLAYAEGMSHGEIAVATGLPLGTVKSHVARSAARLRRWLQPDTVGSEHHT